MNKAQWLFPLWISLLTACGPAPAATSVPATETLPPTKQVTMASTNATTPLLSPTITPTLQPVYKIETLLSGQYLVYVDECDPSDFTSLCSLHVISLDGSVDQSLVSGLPAGRFIYRNGLIASTIEYWEQSNYQYFRIQVLDMGNGKVVDIPTPTGKECRAWDWSPDATQLVVACHQEDLNFEVGLIDVRNGKYALLLQDLNEKGNSDGYASPRWSPDEKWLSFYRLYSNALRMLKGCMSPTCPVYPILPPAKQKQNVYQSQSSMASGAT
jgi:hypothetical protein